MLNANNHVSAPINLSNQVLSLLRFVGKHPLNVLVDSGCSTNFVSTTLVSKLRLSTQQSVEAFQVELADGSYIQCNKRVQQLEFQIQDYRDQLNFSVMPLSHYDMIIGQSWLYQYDPITSFRDPITSFRDHSIRLYHDNQELELRRLFNTKPITMIRLASWEEYLPLVEFSYNNAPHSVTGMTPFQAAYGHTPLVPTNFVLQHKVALADQLVQEMQDILVQVRDKLIHVQQKYQKQTNKHRRHAEFIEGDLVLLYVASHCYKTVKSVFPKLRPRFYGPLKIIKKNSIVSYKLELPSSWGKLHPTFHISWLKQYIQGDSPVPELSSYVPKIEDEHVLLVPEMILDVRQKEMRRKLTTEFLVKWMDLDESDLTWHTDEEMQQYPNLLQEFFDKRQIFLRHTGFNLNGRECHDCDLVASYTSHLLMVADTKSDYPGRTPCSMVTILRSSYMPLHQKPHSFNKCRFDFNKDPAFLWIKELPVCAKETIQRSKVLFFNGFLFDEITPDMITSAVDFAHETGCVVFFDPGPRGNSLCKGSASQQHALQKLLTCSDVLLLTADEAKALTGLEDPTLAAKDLLAKGQRTKWVIVKLGESGCLMVTANNVYTVPAFKVDIKDTVGCGDSFAAAIALGYTRKLPIVSMLALANAVGAATAMGCGAGRNVATLNDVTSILLSSDVCGDCNVIGEVQASSSQQLLKVARLQASDNLVHFGRELASQFSSRITVMGKCD
ncbi:hypothetical protein L7F22_000520 [Adiantum nelumboides]|nr:hypothetical protein [Adiantum nelumboides]